MNVQRARWAYQRIVALLNETGYRRRLETRKFERTAPMRSTYEAVGPPAAPSLRLGRVLNARTIGLHRFKASDTTTVLRTVLGPWMSFKKKGKRQV